MNPPDGMFIGIVENMRRTLYPLCFLDGLLFGFGFLLAGIVVTGTTLGMMFVVYKAGEL